MSSFCLSSAVILRCVPLSSFQSIVILIPTVVEVVFTSSLVITLWNSGHKRHLLLTAEGWVYFLLSIFELLTHVLDSAQRDVDVFAGFDVTVGVASFLPLFFYCFFLYIYSDTELLPNAVSLPRKLGKVASLLLLILIPAIVGFNEVASFVGIERRLDTTSGQIVIGFSSQKNWTLNLFFSSLTLALATLFQAIIFSVTAFRVVVALLNQRRFEQLGQDAVHMVNGMGWLAAGMKLGAIESVVGFAGGSFGIVLTRRILRLLGRACLCFGVVKGVDEVEDFRAVRQDLDRGKSNSKFYQKNPRGLKQLISNPRFSTFQQLSDPLAGTAYLPRDHLYNNHTFDYNRDEKSLKTPEEHLRSLQDVPGLATFESLGKRYSNTPGQRVTVYRNSGGAPTLQLRLSNVELPTPAQIEETVSSRPRSSSSLTGLPPSLIKGSGWTHEKQDSEESYQARRSRQLLSAAVQEEYRNSAAQSITEPSVVEILSEGEALSRFDHVQGPQVNCTPSTETSNVTKVRGDADVTHKNPFELESPQSDETTSPHKFRIVSDQSFRSLPDTLQAVRELANEFPGPPLNYNGQPIMGALTPVSTWTGPAAPSLFSKSVRSSLEAVENAIGTPRASLEKNKRRGGGRTGPRTEDEESLVGMPKSASGSSPQIFVVSDGHGSQEKLVKPKPSFMSSHTNKSIDPFDDSRPTTPVQEIMNRPTLLRPHPRLDIPAHSVSVPTSPDTFSPLSQYPSRASRSSQLDPFNELAVRTGDSSDLRKSGRWKHDSSRLPPPPERAFAPGEGLPTTPVRFSSITTADSSESGSRLSVGVVMLGSTTTVDKLRRPPSRIIWKMPEAVVERGREEEGIAPGAPSLQRNDSDASEARRRQKSIDAAAHLLSNSIPWLKNPEIEEEERKLQEAMASSSSLPPRRPMLSRVKTVGSVDVERTTPTQTMGPMRRSLRVEPIMIPPALAMYGQAVDVSQGDVDDVDDSVPISLRPRQYS
ncbi:hypothetical protein FA13DRAFT_1898547 [Coprinellus micaceus]|uniref:Uncharacterized protein n=1 Tax=Coprinellus micaceus TaxID=71717 RepID=A0A4Y7SVA2_COPMI|nr:hypothetical protein FA13DRAFT_1898547 [Coprinellus micaceus]